ncbi:MAG: carbohydrate-binding family 9-like protein [Clostridia bacterium]|nr:carbohydrate-binding family 9-like protein [Clostridia bacterium]
MKSYMIKKIDGPVTEAAWQIAETANIDFVPWNGAHPYPYKMTSQLLYTDEALYVRQETDERPLTAHYNKPADPVNKDSCMEFFFTPNADDPQLHYFNFEINPLGVIQMMYGINRYEFIRPSVDWNIFDIKSVITPNTWQLTYKIPFSFILEYAEKISNKTIGNFYKCGDCSEIEHYACWSPILCKEEDFHRTEYFGELIFEKGISVSR